MRQMRHPNPLIDVRRPRDRERLGVNPPGFIFKPMPGVSEYRLEICRDRKFAGPTLIRRQVAGPRTLLVLDEPLPPGRWFWRWRPQAGPKWSQVFRFSILPDAAEVRLGSPEQLVAALGDHPRAMVRPGGLAELRNTWRTDRAELLARLVARGEALLPTSHDKPEPPFLDERGIDYNAVHVVWREAMATTRTFCSEMVDLAQAYLLGGDRRFAEAAAARLDSLARWNPDGATSIPHNDEPHMAVMDGGPIAFDWISDCLQGERRARIVSHLAARAENTYRALLDRGYGIEHFGSHSGRMIGFLGQAGLALAGDHPHAGKWLRLVLELIVAMYPVWGDGDGGWGEGFSYCSAYVRWILRFLFSARTALGYDFYRKPFFRNHARWWACCLPANAAQTPFGDGGDRSIPLANAAAITQHLGMMTGDESVIAYGRQCQAMVDAQRTGHGVSTGTPDLIFPDLSLDPLLCLPPDAEAARLKMPADVTARKAPLPRAALFGDIGYVAMRSNPASLDDDICLVLKSSRYGPMGHSHPDQNCFVLSAFGEPLLIRTGYYTGYGSAHHIGWVRQTKAHNGLTVGGVGQWPYQPTANGRIADFRAAEDHAYACGDASGAYGDRLSTFRRHVLFVDYRYFLIIDDLAAPVPSPWDLHLHSAERMGLDVSARRAEIARGRARCDVHFLARQDVRFRLTDQFDPPNDDPGFPDLPNQWHLRMTTVDISTRTRLAMLLLPRLGDERPAGVASAELADGFGARVRLADGTEDVLLIGQPGKSIVHCGVEYGGLAVWLRDGQQRAAIG